MGRYFFTIQVYFRSGLHAFKTNGDPFITAGGRYFKISPVPANALVHGIAAVMLFLNTHDVRDADTRPIFIIKFYLRCAGDIASLKSPVGIEVKNGAGVLGTQSKREHKTNQPTGYDTMHAKLFKHKKIPLIFQLAGFS
jgi:hypothetical protein